MLTAFAASPGTVNPAVQRVVEEISTERIAAIEKKLESFETRNIFSDPNHPSRALARHGAGSSKLKSYSPRLEVSFDAYKVKKQKRVFRDVELVNVVAMLPGALNQKRQFIVSGHYDSLNLERKPPSADPAAAGDPPEIDSEKSAARPHAPGVTDDASGTAAVLEMARVMSQYEFEKPLSLSLSPAKRKDFVGSTLYAAKAHRKSRDRCS
jgi:hypothetical protein